MGWMKRWMMFTRFFFLMVVFFLMLVLEILRNMIRAEM